MANAYFIATHMDALTGDKLRTAAADIYSGRDDYVASPRLLDESTVVLDGLDGPPPGFTVVEKFDAEAPEGKPADLCRKWIDEPEKRAPKDVKDGVKAEPVEAVALEARKQ